jgi:pyridoxal phosphate enzyme (YggS family)
MATMEYSFVKDRVEAIRDRIGAAAERSGRRSSDVELLAVTKSHPIEAAVAAWDAGLTSFGENRVAEAQEKYMAFLPERPGARLDMIGHIQSNKAKKAVSVFSRLQSVDSVALILELDRRARTADSRLEVLLELHTGEESKTGFVGADELYRALELLLSIEDRRLEPRGLMTIAPAFGPAGTDGAAESAVRASFRSLRAALDGARARFGTRPGAERLDLLSMGMSGDFEIAVEEGSNLVRIGTALFGSRTA